MWHFMNSNNASLIIDRPFMSIMGGKTKISSHIVALIPKHRVYIEPFIGAGSVFFKQTSDIEILNDNNKDIYHMWIDIKAIGHRIKQMNFKCTKKQFKTLKESNPKTRFKRLYRNIYISIFSFSGNRISYLGDKGCLKVRSPASYIKRNGALYKQRLKDVNIFNTDYINMINWFDSAETFFYFDPPFQTKLGKWFYKPTNPNDIYTALSHIKGTFILSYENSKEIKKLFSSKKYRIIPIRTTYNISGKPRSITELLIMNFHSKSRKPR